MEKCNLVKPADFSIVYHWQEGSIPPPYHYEYDIRLGPGVAGEIVFTPDYPGRDTPVWTEPLTISEEQFAKLYALMADDVLAREWRKMKQPPVGGSLEWLEVTAGGKQVTVPSFPQKRDAAPLRAIYDTLRAIVPSELWDSLMARLAKHREEYQRRRS
jgi:hypothetical protein